MTALPLAGRVALVTGAGGGPAGGIGSGIARVLDRAGAIVAVNDVSPDAVRATVDDLSPAATGHVADVTDRAAVDRMIADVGTAHGRLDIVVNNAGIVGRHRVADTPDDEWERVMAINLTAPFLVARAGIPWLERSPAGRIVNIASTAGLRAGQLGGASYSASKAGLLGFTRHLALELGPSSITVNAVCPGLVMSPLVVGTRTPEARAMLESTVPLGRGADVEEIGEAVAFLAGDGAGFISGESLVVDGAKIVMQGDFQSWTRDSNPTSS